jgi:cyclopropane fatty-acyl-phospholipid synthase-like methyltransferase
MVSQRAKQRMDLTLQMADVQAWDTLLDLGCGGGYYGVELKAKSEATYVGLDIAYNMLQHGQGLFRRHNLKGFFINAEAAALPLKSGILDKIISIGVINYYPPDNVKKIFEELQRVLQPGASAILSNLRLDPLTWLRSRLPRHIPRPLRIPGPIFPHKNREIRQWSQEYGLAVVQTVPVRKFLMLPFYSLFQVRRQEENEQKSFNLLNIGSKLSDATAKFMVLLAAAQCML